MSTFLFIMKGDVVYYPEGDILGIVKEEFVVNNKRYYFIRVNEDGTEIVFKRGDLIRIGEL